MKLHIFHTGEAFVSQNTPRGNDCSLPKAAGVLQPKRTKLWVPVSAYVIEAPKGTILFDTGWGRNMSPAGKESKRAMRKAHGRLSVYLSTKGRVAIGETLAEQLEKLEIKQEDIAAVYLSHLDCDHAEGLADLKDVKAVYVSEEEREFAKKPSTRLLRYNRSWWKGFTINTFPWDGKEGPFQKSHDVFGDGSVVLIWLPGHTPGHIGIRLRGEDGTYLLLCGDSCYDVEALKENILPGILPMHQEARESDRFLKACLSDPDYKAIFPNHDPHVVPGMIEW